MKIIKSLLVSLFLITAIPSLIYAKEIVEENTDGSSCINLESAYADIYDTSKALTGIDQSIDAVKKAETVASLTNVLSIFVGDRVYCVNDEVSAEKANSLKQTGILGALDNASNSIFAAYPTVNLGEHLAEMFIPAYSDSNSLIASDALNEDKDEEKFYNKIGDKVVDKFVDKSKEAAESTAEIGEGEEASTAVTSSGYGYLKESLKLDILWEISRNMVYVFYVIVVIIIGFAIMFRKSLPGQVTVSLGNTIPNVVIGLVLVTFSFAIVGFIMDVGKVFMNVAGNMFEEAYEDAGIKNDSEIVSIESVGDLTDQALTTSKKDGLIINFVRKIPLIGDSVADFYTGTAGTLRSIGSQTLALFSLNQSAESVADNDLNIDLDAGAVSLDFISDPLIKVGEVSLDIILKGAVKVSLTVLLIRNILLCLICVYASFKLFLTIITTYFKLFLNVVFGPFQILAGSFPGNFSVTINWLKSVVANVLVFVGIFVVVNLFAFLSTAVDPSSFNFFGNKGVMWPDWIISIEGVILIGGYIFASNIPQIINGMLKVGASKEMSMAGESIKKSMSKIPLVGGMFGN